jgi:hypothetical protein
MHTCRCCKDGEEVGVIVLKPNAIKCGINIKTASRGTYLEWTQQEADSWESDAEDRRGRVMVHGRIWHNVQHPACCTAPAGGAFLQDLLYTPPKYEATTEINRIKASQAL